MDRSTIIERLKKLIRHERSAREIGNVEEAAAFAAKIQQFVDRYNIELSNISVDVEIDDIVSQFSTAACGQKWMKLLLHNIALMNGCSVVFSGKSFEIHGTDIDIQLTSTLYDYFAELGIHLQKLAVISYKLSPDYKRKRKKARYTLNFKESFGIGYTTMLITRLKQQQAESARGSQAMIFIGNKLQRAESRARSFGATTRRVLVKKARYRDPAFGHGVVAGSSVALTPNTIAARETKQLN